MAAPTAAPAVAATATAAPTPVENAATQVLEVNLGGEPSSLDPQLAAALHEISVIRQVFQSLLGFAPDLSLVPVVATEVPTVANGGISADGLVYTFRLANLVTWSDGRKVQAEDFVFAIKRLLAARPRNTVGECLGV